MKGLSFLITFIKSHSAAAALLFVGLFIQVFRVMGWNLDQMPGDLGDTRFILAIAEYNYQWLCGRYGDYWDGFFMYPDQEVISYSDNVLGSLPLYALFRIFGADYLMAFQLLIVFSHVLNFTFAYLCFLKMGSRPLSAAAGAFIFAFDLGLTYLHNHPQFSFRYAIPLCFLFLQQYLSDQRWRSLLYALLALVFQFYLSVYLGYFLFLGAAVYFISYHAVNTRQWLLLKHQGFDLLKSAPLALLLLAPLMYHYIKRGLITGYYNDYNYYMQTVPRLSSYVKAFDGSWLWAALRKTDVASDFSWQHPLFPGLLVFMGLIGAFDLAYRGHRQILVLLLCLFLILSFTLYHEGHTMYGYLMKIPGIKAIRVVSRLIALLVFFAGWLVCLLCDRLLNSGKAGALLLPVFLPLLLVADNFTLPDYYKRFSLEDCRLRVDALRKKTEQSSEAAGDKVLVFLSQDSVNVHFHQLDAMLCALQLGRKTVNGYSSSSHRYYGPFWRKPNRLSLRMWCKEMKLDQTQLLVLE